jgi:hypothetical protein
MTPSTRQPPRPTPDDPHAVTRRRLARLLALGAVRAAVRREDAPPASGAVLDEPVAGGVAANRPGGTDALAG